MLQHLVNLLVTDAGKPRQKILNGGPTYQGLKEGRDWDASVSERPCAAHPIRGTFNRLALTPITPPHA